MRICECVHALIEHPNDECSRCECKAYSDDSGLDDEPEPHYFELHEKP